MGNAAQGDAVELALASALIRAAESRCWPTVELLAAELKARRERFPTPPVDLILLDNERTKRRK